MKLEERLAKAEEILKSSEEVADDNRSMNIRISELHKQMLGTEAKLEETARLHNNALEKAAGNLDLVNIYKNELNVAHEKYNNLQKIITSATDNKEIKVNGNVAIGGNSNAEDNYNNVILFHDSLCKNIKPTILINEKLTTKKIWAPTPDDIQKEITQISKAEVIVVQSLTRTLNTDSSVSEIINQTAETVEMCLERADKVVISSIINRDDDPLVNAQGELVNANLKFKYLNNPNVSICNNDNLLDKKKEVAKQTKEPT